MTSPASRIIADADIGHAVLDIIRTAKRQVVLVSPFIDYSASAFWKQFADAVRKARQRKVLCLFIYPSKESGRRHYTRKARYALKQFSKFGFIFREVLHLHAKLYFNESSAVVTSMNLSNQSLSDDPISGSREVGIRLKSRQDVKGLRQYVEELIGEELTSMNTVKGNSQAYCIHCGKCGELFRDIIYIPGKEKPAAKTPYCDDCHPQWNKDENHPEHYCHACGRKATASFADPFCLDHSLRLMPNWPSTL